MANSKEEHTTALAAYLPGGSMFEAKNVHDSNLRALLRGIASEFKIAQDYLQTFEREYFPDRTTLYLSEWESVVSIPDDCLVLEENADARRSNILVKLANMNLQVAQDFVDLADFFGQTITATPGEELTSTIVFDSITTARNTLVIDFPITPGTGFTYDFSIIFGDNVQFIIKCLFEKQKAANTVLLFR